MMSDSTFNFLMKLIGILAVILIFREFIKKNKFILEKLNRIKEVINKFYYEVIGKRVNNLQVRVARKANLNKDSKFFKVYNFYDNIIINLDMKIYNVTVTGLIVFMLAVALLAAFIITYTLKSVGGITIVMTGVIFYLQTTLFRLISLTKYEKREAEIMDAVDLLVSDVRGGVYNAIVKYQDSFSPNIRKYFKGFIEDVQNKGYSFNDAIVILNDNLGPNFTEFTHKAILYEAKADKDLDDIFSTIIETNRERRILRYLNDIQFRKIRRDFLVSLALILGYIAFTVLTDKFIITFLTKSFYGKLLVVIDIFLVGWVMSYLAKIKSENL